MHRVMEADEAERRMFRSPFHQERRRAAAAPADGGGAVAAPHHNRGARRIAHIEELALAMRNRRAARVAAGQPIAPDVAYHGAEDAQVVPEETLEGYGADIKRARRVFGSEPGVTSEDIARYDHRRPPTHPHVMDADGTVVDWRGPLRRTRTVHRTQQVIQRRRAEATAAGRPFVDPRTPATGPNAALIAMAQATSRRPLTLPEAAEKMKDTGELPAVAPHSTALAHRVHNVDMRPGHLGGRKRPRRRKKTQKKSRKTRRKRREGKTRKNRRKRKSRRRKSKNVARKIIY